MENMYAKRAFVHWYVAEGVEEVQFSEAQENITTIIQDYKDLENDIAEGEDEDALRSDKF